MARVSIPLGQTQTELPLLRNISSTLGSNSVLKEPMDLRVRAHDASHFLQIPRGIVIPKNVEEVKEVFFQARKTNTPITFRSGGTSLSGQGVTDSILLDTRREFTGVEVLDNGARIKLQPGVTIRHANARLARYKRKLGPDPASEIACTIGGVVANNSSGMSCGIDFNTYQTLESMTFTLPSGTTINTAESDADDQLLHHEPELYHGLIRLRDEIRDKPHLVAKIRQQFSMKNTMGYGVNSFLDWYRPLDILRQIIIGSEGTLAFVSEAVFRTIPLHSQLATAFLIFDDIFQANNSLPQITATNASAVELLDSLSLRIGQESPGAPPALKPLNIGNKAALLIEYQAESSEELEHLVSQATSTLHELRLTEKYQFSTDPVVRSQLWHLRKGLYTAVAGARPTGTTALLEDIVVPVTDLAETCTGLSELFSKYSYENSVIFGHAKDGNVHFMLTDDFSDVRRLDKYQEFTEDMVDLVLSYQGSLKAEHGTGRVMSAYVERQFGPELYQVMKTVKALCDPHGVLNPGVIINPDSQAHLHHIKAAVPVAEIIDSCVECGYCEPVCPSKNLTLTPRQRIVLEREKQQAILVGDTQLFKQLDKSSRYSSIDTCAVDGMCQTACPVLINTGELVSSLRTTVSNPLVRTLWKSFAHTWAPVTKTISFALTVTDKLPPSLVSGPNKLARNIFGPDNIPLLTPDLPRGGRKRRKKDEAHNKPAFVYFPSCMNTLFGVDNDHNTQQSLMNLLKMCDIDFILPENIDSLCCGTPWSSKGMNKGYAHMVEVLQETLLTLSDGGKLPILVDASSCAEGLVKSCSDRPELRMIDAIELVQEIILSKLPPVPKVDKIAVHPTCSSTRSGTNEAMLSIASFLAKEVFVPPSWGCCGFAGDRGMLHPELTESATYQQAQEILEFDADLFGSCNRACEIGMSRATGENYRHIIDILHAKIQESGKEKALLTLSE